MSERFEGLQDPPKNLKSFLLITLDFCRQQLPPKSSIPIMLPVSSVLCCINLTHPYEAASETFFLCGKVQLLLILCIFFHSRHRWKARNLKGKRRRPAHRSSNTSGPGVTHTHSSRHSLERNISFSKLAFLFITL